jgi:hypothetical protein
MRRTPWKSTVKADAERQAKRRRAIKGEIKPGYEFEALCAVAHDCNKSLWRFGRIEIIGQMDESELESDIVEVVQDWLREADEDALPRILRLDKRTRRWLSDRIEGWKGLEQRALQVSPVPGRILRAVNSVLCEFICEQLEHHNNLDFWETYFDEGPEVETVWETFFGDEWANDRAQDTRFKKLRNKAVQELRQALPDLAKYLDSLEIKDKRGWPPKWMGQKGIRANLKRKGNRHFVELYGMLREDRKKAGDAQDGDPVLVKPDFEAIGRRTGLSQRQVNRYLAEMARWGIVEKKGRDGERGQMLYSMGYWAKGRSKFPRPVYWLKNTPRMVEALKRFDTNYPLRGQR